MIEWDNAKCRSNIVKHGFDFRDAESVFDNLHVTIPSPYPQECRWLAIGMIGESCVTIIYTLRGLNRRIISIRKARGNERNHYLQILNR